MNGHRLTFWERAEAMPPILVRLLARHPNGKPKSAGEIARDSSVTAHEEDHFSNLGSWTLSCFEAESLSQEKDWCRVKLIDMACFLRGCGLDFCDGKQMVRVDNYLKSKPNFEYLRRSPDWKTLYLPMLVKWRRSYGEVKPDDAAIWKPVRNLLISLTPILKVS